MLNERIKLCRQKLGLTQVQMAQKLGISKHLYNKYERTNTRPGYEVLSEIARLSGVSTDYLLGLTSGDDEIAMRPDPWGIGQPSTPKAVRIPVLGIIPAGVPLEAVEDVLDWEEIPIEWTVNGKEFFGLKLRGDSMAPKYESGDIVILQRAFTCSPGSDCAVIINGDDATFKRVFAAEDGGIVLHPLNPLFPVIAYTAEQCEELPVRIIGVATQIRRSV